MVRNGLDDLTQSFQSRRPTFGIEFITDFDSVHTRRGELSGLEMIDRDFQ